MFGIKINSVDFQEIGFTADKAKELCQMSEDSEFDFVELSGKTFQSLVFSHQRESKRKREVFFGISGENRECFDEDQNVYNRRLKILDGMAGVLKTVDGAGWTSSSCVSGIPFDQEYPRRPSEGGH
jgi:hypothetical protein